MSDPQTTGAFAWTQEPWGRALKCTRLDVLHLFTSRDVALTDDTREWTAVAASVGVALDRLRLVTQVHGAVVAIARAGDTSAWDRPSADVIVSDDPSVAIGVRVADCAPVLLHDPVRRTVGAAHAGWRGTASKAAAAAVRAMAEEFGSRPSDMVAAIGPCLGACCGEVGPDVVEVFEAGGAGEAEIGAWFSPGTGDRLFLDLERANHDQLVAAGLLPGAIFGSRLCTRTHRDRLHSYRADRGAAGRMLAAIRAPG